MVNKKVQNLFYTGQLTVPPAIISGKVVAIQLIQNTEGIL